MTEIIVIDPLRKSVERASGGKQTVLWTKSGFPTYMNIIPQFRLEELHPTALGTGVHPAFIVDGVEKPEIFIGTYQAVLQDGEAISLPGQDPATSINFDTARQACKNAGPGFHLMTNWEWAALALQAIANGCDVRGNTDCGRSHSNRDEIGKPLPGSQTTRTGSGPASWRHDGTEHGIADMVGNIWEWVDGLKLMSGRIIIPKDNAYGLDELQWSATGACFDIVDGYPHISDSITNEDYDSVMFRDMTANPGFEIPLAIRQALLLACPGIQMPGRVWADNSEDFEALPIRGGGWNDGSHAGLAALYLFFGRSYAVSGLGFRPAFIG
ncbi:MAG: hypothetical protein A2075_09255 [Geobacteraceae bacterium GWC2_58_44]|nr:MAG: hypothetical protein A2075_09255 [Geobacteraceae bacterium GWC2_58_44]HBG07700.1 hypothetical protein [Geobacter sp.]